MNPKNIFTELKRRNVYKVAVAYGVVAWLLLQAASILFPTFEAPPWTMKVFVGLTVLGFPIALIIAWAFELTPEGLKRTEFADGLPKKPARNRVWIYVVVVAGAISIGLFFIGRFTAAPKQRNKLEQMASSENPSTAKPLGEVSLPALVKIVSPSVVQVIGYKNGKIVQTGSGFIAEDGAVVTNFHVVNGIDDAFIKLSNGSQKQVLGLAHYSEGADLAILLVREVDGIRGLSLAASLPEVGERIYVLGNPEIFTGTLSDGLVSAKRRDDYGAVVQITAPISHGSSGSPVFDNGGLVVGVAMGSVESGQSLNFARSAGTVRAMLQSRQGFTTFSDLNKAQAEKKRATAASDSVSPPRLPQKTAPEQELTQVYVKKYGVSALLPTDVFPDAKKLSSNDESFLQGKSWTGQTTLTFSSVREPLAKVYAECATEHSPQAPSKTVDYKVLKPTWFVVSGDLGPEADSSLGFYTKGVKQDSVVVIMHFQYRQDDFPFTDETFTAMSRSFDGH